MQDLSKFSLPFGFRGRSAGVVQLWWIAQAVLIGCSPQFMYGWRRFLLRLFGADIGVGVLIRPSARVTYPWKVKIGEHSWIGDEVCLYSLGEISIGAHSVISQRSYICAAAHRSDSPSFTIYSDPVTIGDGCWVATDVFVGPGVSIGDSAVVGARSSVWSDLPAGQICRGNPARVVRAREFAI